MIRLHSVHCGTAAVSTLQFTNFTHCLVVLPDGNGKSASSKKLLNVYICFHDLNLF